MNETAIAKFLAEQMGWRDFWGDEEAYDNSFILPTGEIIGFFPFEKFKDAWRIVDFIKDDWYKIEWLAGLYNVKFTKPGMKAAEQTYHEHTSEKLCEAITIAAARALATGEQLVGLGL